MTVKEIELRISYFIAKKNFIIALANRELDLGGWTMDFSGE